MNRQNDLQVILDTHFRTLEHLVVEVAHWDLDFRLMDSGGFSGHVKQLASRDVLVTYARFLKGLDQAGSTPPGYKTFVIPGNSCNGFWWRGYRVSRDDLLIFPDSNELRSASHADFEVFTISLRTAYLEQLMHELGIDSSTNNRQEVIPLQARMAKKLRQLAGLIVQSEGGMTARMFSNDLAEILARHMTGIFVQRRPSRRRDLAVSRVTEYVCSTPVPTTQMAELCRIGGVSERTLQYAFRERYGIPPNVFVKRWKLNSARRLLQQADPEKTNISGVAMSLGFFHQGQFAADYKLLFSELPSDTLSRLTTYQ